MGIKEIALSALGAMTGGPHKDAERLRKQMEEDPCAELVSEWTAREEWMRPRTRKWKESLGFDRGDHWGQWNEQSRTWTSAALPSSAGVKDKPFVNHYASIIRTIVAHMTKNRPIAEVLPENSSAEAVEAANACNHVLDHIWSDIDIRAVEAEVIRWLLHANTCYVRPRWDPNAGPLIPLEVPPELEGQSQQYAREGKVVIDVLSPMQVYPNKEAKNWADCGDVIIEHLLTSRQVKLIWPDLANEPEPDTTGDDGTVFLAQSEMEQGYGSDKGGLDYVRVLEQFVLPCPDRPEGRHLCVTKGMILSDEPYGEPEFPIIHVSGEPYPLSFHGRSWMWDLLGPQRAYNSAHTQVLQHVDLACNPPWLVPKGSVDNKSLTKRAGAIIEFQSNLGAPQPASFAQVPAWVQGIPALMQKIMADLSVSEVLQGRVPYSGMSGRTIAFISDLDSTRLGTMASSVATMLGKLGESCLDLVQQNGSDVVTFRQLNDSVAEMMAFQKTSLRYGAVRVTESSLLPTPAIVRRENLLQQLQAKAISPEEYKEALRGAGGPEDTDMQAADRAWARDNITVIQQGGQPFTGNYMDYPVHHYETKKFMKSAQFRRLDPAMIQRFEEYEQKLGSLAQPPAPASVDGAPQAPSTQKEEGEPGQDTMIRGQNPGVNAQEEQALGIGNMP